MSYRNDVVGRGMPVTNDDDKAAIELVLRKYGAHLPSGVAQGIRGKAVGEIIKILPASQYRPQFDQYFRSFFAPICSKAFGLRVIDIAKDLDNNVCGSFNCPAFCSPAMASASRVIYISQDEPNTFATLCHELCHYISHGNFYPEFYALGGENPNILEGVTEYLTRNLNPTVARDRASRRKYQAQYDSVMKALIAGSQSELDVIHFALRGQYVSLKGLGAVLPRV